MQRIKRPKYNLKKAVRRAIKKHEKENPDKPLPSGMFGRLLMKTIPAKIIQDALDAKEKT